jgi:pilus assembly protein FimV
MPAEPPAELASIDFDFLDEPLPAVSEPAPDPLPEPSAEMEMAPEVEPVEPVPEPQQTDMPEIQDLEFSLKDDAPVAEQPLIDALPDDIDAPVEATAPLAIDIPDIDIPELGGTDAPMAAESDTAAKIDAAATDPLDFDLSDISLELKPEDAGAAPDLDFEQVDMSSTLDASSDNAEMATKLDLAIAYQEIGDKEGARELLDEVLKGGSPEQSERAKSLLLELA